MEHALAGGCRVIILVNIDMELPQFNDCINTEVLHRYVLSSQNVATIRNMSVQTLAASDLFTDPCLRRLVESYFILEQTPHTLGSFIARIQDTDSLFMQSLKYNFWSERHVIAVLQQFCALISEKLNVLQLRDEC